jgi:ubiquinone/menaquinone biosynthesis C-methylase UbiE
VYRQLLSQGPRESEYPNRLDCDVRSSLAGIVFVRGEGVLDLGCGSLDPLLQSIYLVCNGVGHVTAIDPDECPSPERSAYSMANLLSDIMLDPEKWCAGAVSPNEVRARTSLFDVAALRQGKMLEGISKAPIQYAVGNVQEICTDPNVFDIVMSFSVIEHIMDPSGVIGHLGRIIAPGGVLVSQVDFSDHRQFSVSGHNFWTFMTNSGPDQTGINQLRMSEIFRIIEDSGLSIVLNKPYRVPLPDNVRVDLRPRFAAMSDEDLESVSTYFCAIKPGAKSGLSRLLSFVRANRSTN